MNNKQLKRGIELSNKIRSVQSAIDQYNHPNETLGRIIEISAGYYYEEPQLVSMRLPLKYHQQILDILKKYEGELSREYEEL